MPAAAYKAKDTEICTETTHNVSHDITSGPNKGHYSCDATTCTQLDAHGTLTGVVATHFDNCTKALTGGGSTVGPQQLATPPVKSSTPLPTKPRVANPSEAPKVVSPH